MTTGRDSLMRAVCLLSGSGTNLQAILDNISAKKNLKSNDFSHFR
ncbi:MAG: hypothetical protein Ct9H300mP6_09880 [Gammaproteobacteria bacterium]|nr:MAG: hypothetical protein Ct9H300mP6_09880 [Gammaproteobacteria bacterium]